LETRIQIEYSDSKIAEAIAQAVSPDNFKTPKGLRVQTLREESKVITVITCENKLATLIATIDDLLFCISTAEKTLQIVK